MGVWEERRLAAMIRIQEVALKLFDARSYQAVTIEEIASAAAVSPIPIYRYFGTKEAIVLWDEHDRGLFGTIAAGLDQHATLSAVAAALDRVASQVDALDPERRDLVHRRLRHIRNEPALVEAMHQQTDAMVEQLRAVIEEHRASNSDDLEGRVIAGAIGQAVLTALFVWAESDGESLADLFRRSLRALDRGLTFSTPEPNS